MIDADGGTRTAAITGSFVAVSLALKKLAGRVPGLADAVRCGVAAVSVGMVNGTPCLDLNYEEDKSAEVDMNVVKTSQDQFVEVQGTAEGKPFDQQSLDSLLLLAHKGIKELLTAQERVLK